MSLSSLIQRSERKNSDSQNIENETIYKKVFGKRIEFIFYIEEFSNFSKNFQNKAPKNNTGLEDFLSIFE